MTKADFFSCGQWLLLALTAVIAAFPLPLAAADTASCVAGAKRESIRCWDRCSGTGARLDRCTDQCEDAFEKDRRSCARDISASISADRSRLSGTKRSGEDGCYFGECPADLDRQVRQTHAEPDAFPRRPSRPVRQTPRDEPLAQAATTNICQTPLFWCVMNEVGPVNYPCWCMNPLTGFANGITVLKR